MRLFLDLRLTLGHSTDADVTLTCIIHLNIIADQSQLLRQRKFSVAVDSWTIPPKQTALEQLVMQNKTNKRKKEYFHVAVVARKTKT